ncbi:MAG: ABC transporter permease, partial [Lachnospiraceae bacterium]|nr:ABC transporter permease [Lachnospiraceae bacterium]
MNEAATVKVKKSSAFGEFIYRLTKSASAKIGLIILGLVILFCIIGPLFVPYGVNEMDMTLMFAKPSAAHPFGCDSLGRDIMIRLMYGGRYSLILGLSASVLSGFIGIIIGCFAGYVGGVVETIIMRFMDVWSALPAMLLCILLSAVFGAGFIPTIVALIIGQIPGGVRMTRG